MKRVLPAIVLAVILSPCIDVRGNPSPAARLPPGRDAYLMENDLVYARFLELLRDGSYRQINRDCDSSAEVDRGSWTQDKGGTLHLRSTCRALRPRALLCGPLSVVTANRENLEKLPALLDSVRAFLAGTSDAVFDAGEAANAGGPGIIVSGDAATFSRADLERLARQIDDTLRCEREGIYVLAPVGDGSSALFASPDAVFQAGDVTRVQHEYRVPRGGATPFYFARVDARTFAKEVGRWQGLHLPGELK